MYASPENMTLRFGDEEIIQLTDRIGTQIIDLDLLNGVIADVDGVIDGYLAGRYTLPLASVPPVLTYYACDMVRSRLYKDAAPEIVLKREEDAIKFLTLVGQGKLNLGAVPEPVSANEVQVVVQPRRRTGLGL